MRVVCTNTSTGATLDGVSCPERRLYGCELGLKIFFFGINLFVQPDSEHGELTTAIRTAMPVRAPLAGKLCTERSRKGWAKVAKTARRLPPEPDTA